MHQKYQQFLSSLAIEGKYRRLGTCGQSNMKLLDFSTNDYLGLCKNRQLTEAAINAGKKYGVGSTGSRLLSGNIKLYSEFEKRIAKDKKRDNCLIFSTGFQANFSTLSALLDTKILKARPIVFFDRLNHSSLYQAVFHSGAKLCRYRHLDMNNLENLLQEYKNDLSPKFIVSETVFGMDGDIVPLKKIAELAKNHGAFLYLDEAHATGLFGPKGYGLSTTIDLKDVKHLVMGTFSKALGCSGGYIACDNIIHDFLVNKAHGFIYSTAPSPVAIAAAFESWKMIETLDHERKKLAKLSELLRIKLKSKGFDIGGSSTHIVPIILGSEESCLKSQEQLLKESIAVSAIRPPTVPPNSSRLRVALTAQHNQEDIEKLILYLCRSIA